jgi:hypothetical protein
VGGGYAGRQCRMPHVNTDVQVFICDTVLLLIITEKIKLKMHSGD